MTVRKKQVGTGITAREETLVQGTGASAIFPGKRAMTDPDDFRALGDIMKMAGLNPLVEVRAIFEGIAESSGRAQHPPEDSEQWFAEKILENLDRAVSDRSKGRHDDAERWTFEAGLTAGIAAMKFEWEGFALTGRKVTEGGEKGSEKAHGTRGEKQERYARFQETVDGIYAENPGMSWTRIKDIASDRLKEAGEKGCSARTIQEHCANPKKK